MFSQHQREGTSNYISCYGVRSRKRLLFSLPLHISFGTKCSAPNLLSSLSTTIMLRFDPSCDYLASTMRWLQNSLGPRWRNTSRIGMKVLVEHRVILIGDMVVLLPILAARPLWRREKIFSEGWNFLMLVIKLLPQSNLSVPRRIVFTLAIVVLRRL
jgi:hypothetical protein